MAYWADKIAKEIISSGKYTPFWVDDMKTPSGFAHIGSLRGPIIHSLIFRALIGAGSKAKFTFVINDFDPADELPPEFKEELKNYLGFPLRKIPSPDSNFDSLGELLADDLKKTLISLGVEAKFLSSWDMYHQGKFDGVIREALDSSEKIQDIYQEVSGSKKKEIGWLPFQVVCENCGNLGTTKVYKWDGKEVSYKCEPSMVSWAVGCRYEGKISPFGGTGKLPWKVDWPAHWKVIGITVEGAGKDHASAGGSYDIAMELCEKVFKYPHPFKLPYEFFLIGGKKMSSSKGLGLKAHDIVRILPPSVARFLFAKGDYNKQINFDPIDSMAIPDIFDEYDRAWKAYATGEDADLARVFELSQINKVPEKKEINLPRFRDIANNLQQPSIDIYEMFPKTPKEILDERIKYAKVWLKDFAPENAKFEVKTMTKTFQISGHITFSKKFSDSLIQSIESANSPEELEKKIYELIKESKQKPKNVFAEIYTILIGKQYGPKLAWLIWENKEKAIKNLQK